MSPLVEEILGSKVKLAILRNLIIYEASTGRGIAKKIGVSPSAVSAALKDLVKIGLIKCYPAGNAHLYLMNEEHPYYRIVKSLFEHEKNSYGGS